MNKSVRVYFIAMGVYWIAFGFITIFFPGMMDLFQTEEGIKSKTIFSYHVWLHGGFDIVAFCILLFTLSGEKINVRILRAAAFAALMPTLAIAYSILATPFWNPVFIGAGMGCFAFVIWGFVLASKINAMTV